MSSERKLERCSSFFSKLWFGYAKDKINCYFVCSRYDRGVCKGGAYGSL